MSEYRPLQHNPKDPEERARMMSMLVRNLTTTHDQLQRDVPHVLRQGMQWYDQANSIAEKLGHKYGHGNRSLEVGAGVLAALSPRMEWSRNIHLADEMLRTGEAGHFTVQTNKARRIIEGENPTDVLGALKEGNFYGNISRPDDPNPVTVDRHAHDLAMGMRYGERERGLGAVGRYNTFVEAIGTASRARGIEVPSRFQAGTWVGHVGGHTQIP